jgi:signal transduction histidine kinase
MDVLERLAIVDEVAGQYRHDLRNKISSVRNAAYYLRRRLQTTDIWAADPRVPEFLHLIEDQMVACDTVLAEHAPRLLAAREIKRVKALACVDRAVATARVPHTVEKRIEPFDWHIRADVDGVALALRCLIENASEAMDGMGSITLRGERDDARVRIMVIDGGPGISVTDCTRVLSPFFTTKQGHSGLGLNVARRATRRFGGDVSVEPTASGACVVLTLPIAEDEAPG